MFEAGAMWVSGAVPCEFEASYASCHAVETASLNVAIASVLSNKEDEALKYCFWDAYFAQQGSVLISCILSVNSQH